MDLLRNPFGSLTSGIIRPAVTTGILFLAYLFIVKPVLDTTADVIHSTGLDKVGDSLEGVSKEIKREVRHSFESTSPGAQRKRLVHCVRRANGNAHRIEACTQRF